MPTHIHDTQQTESWAPHTETLSSTGGRPTRLLPHSSEPAAPAKVFGFLDPKQTPLGERRVRGLPTQYVYTADQHTLYILESNLPYEHEPHERGLAQTVTLMAP